MKDFSQIVSVMVISLVSTVGSKQVLADSVQFKPATPNFSEVAIDTCRSKKIQAINAGPIVIKNPEFSLKGSAAFRIQKHFRECPNLLNPGEKCRTYIDFCPSDTKSYETSLTFSGSQQVVQVKGKGKTRDRGG